MIKKNIKIMSFNILAAEWIDKYYYPTVSKKIVFNRKERLKKILTWINNFDPDIILLQEVMRLEYNSLYFHLKNQYIFSPLNPIIWTKGNDTKFESGNITLIKKSFTTAEIKHYRFNYGICSVISSVSLSIVNVHLDQYSCQTRYKQIKNIEPLLYSSDKCILGGDFNQSYKKNSKIYNLPKFYIHNKLCQTYYIERKMDIDNIMTRGFTIYKSINNCNLIPTSIEEGFKIYGSDHIPIVVNIIL